MERLRQTTQHLTNRRGDFIMRVETTTRNLYKFEELDQEIKQKAIDGLYDINIDHEWWDCTFEDAERIGLKITEFDIDRGSCITATFDISANEVAQNIFNNHGEPCETFKTASEFMEKWQPVFDEYLEKEGYELEDQLMDLETEFLKSLSEDYLIMLRKEYEYLTTEEAIIETIESNDYEFDGNGKLA